MGQGGLLDWRLSAGRESIPRSGVSLELEHKRNYSSSYLIHRLCIPDAYITHDAVYKIFKNNFGWAECNMVR
jgi:hypothetical protein